MLKELTLENLKALELESDGPAQTFDSALQDCGKDCVGRPHIDKPRTLTLTLKVTPVTVDTASGPDCKRVNLEMALATKMPPRIGAMPSVKVRRSGQMYFDFSDQDDE